MKNVSLLVYLIDLRTSGAEIMVTAGRIPTCVLHKLVIRFIAAAY